MTALPASAARRHSLFSRPVFVAATALAIVGFVQLWLDTGGRLVVWPHHSVFYEVLADAFMHHQISLRIPPPRELATLPDPYDPAANLPYRWHDVAYYDGKYYLPWGPVPGLIVAFLGAMGIDTPDYDDEALCALFLFGAVVMATILISQARARLFPRLSPWVVLPPILALGLGESVLRCGEVYGAAIAAGQFFLLAGLCAAWFGLFSKRARPVWLATAGVCWALSAGSRASLAPALAALAAITVWQVLRKGDEGLRCRSRILAVAALAIPLVVGAGLMAWYNFARFHSVTEFGVHDQLAGRNQHTGPAAQLFSVRYVAAGLIRYLFEPPAWSKRFPFISAGNDAARTSFDERLGFPDVYGFERLVGLIWAQPFLIFCAVVLTEAALRRTLFAQAEPSNRQSSAFLVAALTVGGIVGFLPALAYNYSAIRYVNDAVPCFAVLATLGYFKVLDASHRRWIGAAIVALIVVQCLTGILLGISGSPESFAEVNPGLYHEMVLVFSIR